MLGIQLFLNHEKEAYLNLYLHRLWYRSKLIIGKIRCKYQIRYALCGLCVMRESIRKLWCYQNYKFKATMYTWAVKLHTTYFWRFLDIEIWNTWEHLKEILLYSSELSSNLEVTELREIPIMCLRHFKNLLKRRSVNWETHTIMYLKVSNGKPFFSSVFKNM